MDSDRRSTQVERLELVDTGRRRRWSEDEKLKIVLESLQTPRQISATARRYGISRSLLIRWRRAFRAERNDGVEQHQGFMPAKVAPESEAMPAPVGSAGGGAIEIEFVAAVRMRRSRARSTLTVAVAALVDGRPRAPAAGRRSCRSWRCIMPRGTGGINSRSGIFETSRAFCKPTPMTGTMSSTSRPARRGQSRRRFAGRTPGGSSLNWPISPPRAARQKRRRHLAGGTGGSPAHRHAVRYPAWHQRPCRQ
jgi:transposase